MDRFKTDINNTNKSGDVFLNNFAAANFLPNRNFDLQIKSLFQSISEKTTDFVSGKNKTNGKNIIYVTLDCPEYMQNSAKSNLQFEYIMQMRKQYPENDIRILIPLINIQQNVKPNKYISFSTESKSFKAERTSLSFRFFQQNKFHEAILYKFLPDNSHIQVYGLFSSCYSYCKSPVEMSKLQNLSAFLKASRICIKKLISTSSENFKPDIVHCENIPFFLGAEFEDKFSYPVKVVQVIKDFAQINLVKTEPFWAAINMAEPRTIKTICKDITIKKYITRLFNLHNTKRFYNINDCLDFIYNNYYKFRKYMDKGEELDENLLFNRLNTRILKLFPHIISQNNNTYNTMQSTLSNANAWVTLSKTYHDIILEVPVLTSEMYAQILKTKEKSSYVLIGLDTAKYNTENKNQIYHPFNQNNFRDLRSNNKFTLLKEFHQDKIHENSTDKTLFRNNNVSIAGYLDSFYEAPLLFYNSSCDIFANGIDIMFNSILTLFKLYKNIQCIINIPNGMNVNYIKTWVELLFQQENTKGRLMFIDGEIDLPKFYASADITLFPHRLNINTQEHLLAMHYGCIPVVSRNGLFNDQVVDIFDNITDGCGFKTKENILLNSENKDIFITPLLKALNIYQNNPSSWNLLIKNCLNKDVSWNFEVLEKYNQIYKTVCENSNISEI